MRINSRALFAGFITITMLSGCGKTDTAGNSVIPLPTYKIIKLDTLKKDSTAKMSSKIIDWMGANTSMLSTRYSSGFISGKSDIGNYTGSGDIYIELLHFNIENRIEELLPALSESRQPYRYIPKTQDFKLSITSVTNTPFSKHYFFKEEINELTRTKTQQVTEISVRKAEWSANVMNITTNPQRVSGALAIENIKIIQKEKAGTYDLQRLEN